MTLSTTSNKVSYSFSSTSITEFTIPFFFIEDADITAILRDSNDVEATWALSTDYTLSGSGDESGGILTATNPLSTGETLVIKRIEQFTQPSDLPTAGPLPSGTLEEGLDRLTMLSQQLNEVDSRVPQLAATSTYSNLTLPDPEADKLIGWNPSGTDIQNITAADVSLTTVSAFMATVLDDTTAAAALTTLGGANLTAANTFTKTQTWTKGADVASANALTLGSDGNYFDVTGTTTITSIATVAVGTWIKLHFDGALTLTHHATNLILPGAANITSAAGDEAEFVEYAAGDWRCTSYLRAGGIVVADLADGTDGELITWDSSGVPAVVAAGTASQVLTSNGAGAAPTFQAAGSSGGLVLIGTATASASASITVTGLTSTHESFLIVGSDLVPATDGVDPWLRLGDSAGVDSGASDYAWTSEDALLRDTSVAGTGATTTYERDPDDNAIHLFGLAGQPIGNAANEGLGFHAWLHNPFGDAYPMLDGNTTYMDTGTLHSSGRFAGVRRALITTDRVNFLFSSGNIASGRLTVWGLAHA